jgi:hypothetical protein
MEDNWEREIIEEDCYNEEWLESAVDNDEMDALDAEFMSGYLAG